jgi:hypothetical protein
MLQCPMQSCVVCSYTSYTEPTTAFQVGKEKGMEIRDDCGTFWHFLFAFNTPNMLCLCRMSVFLSAVKKID